MSKAPTRAKQRGAPSKYIHLLRAMRPGDVIYLPESLPRLDRALAASIYREGGKAETACLLASNLDPACSHRIVRITMIAPLARKESS